MWESTRPYATFKYDPDTQLLDCIMLCDRSQMTEAEWHGVLSEEELNHLYVVPHHPIGGPAFIEVDVGGIGYRCVRGDVLSPDLIDTGVEIDGAGIGLRMYRDDATGYCYPIAYEEQDDFLMGLQNRRDDNREPVDSMDQAGLMLSGILPEGIPTRLTGTIYRDPRYGSLRLA